MTSDESSALLAACPLSAYRKRGSMCLKNVRLVLKVMSVQEDAFYVMWKWLVSRGVIALCKRAHVICDTNTAIRRLECTKCIEYAVRVLPTVCKFLQYEHGEDVVVHSCLAYNAYLRNHFLKQTSLCKLARRDPATLHLFETNTLKTLVSTLVANCAARDPMSSRSSYHVSELIPTLSTESSPCTLNASVIKPFNVYYLSRIRSTSCPLQRLSLVNTLKQTTAYSINAFNQNHDTKLLGMQWLDLVKAGEFVLNTQQCCTNLVRMVSYNRIKAFLALLVMIECTQRPDVYMTANELPQKVLAVHCARCNCTILHRNFIGNSPNSHLLKMQLYKSMHQVLQSLSSYKPTKWIEIYKIAVNFATRNYANVLLPTGRLNAYRFDTCYSIMSFFHRCARIELPTCSKVCLQNVLTRYTTVQQNDKFPLNELHKWRSSKDIIAKRIATTMINIYALSFRTDMSVCFRHDAEDFFERHEIDIKLHTNMQTTSLVLDMTLRV